MAVRTRHIECDSELDRGHGARERERLCIATRKVRPVTDLIRFVVGPEGEAVPDIKSRLPGRGLWVTATREAIEDAVRRKAFARGFKRDVRLLADLASRTERLLQQAVVDALAVACKAGLVATGFSGAAAALDRGQAVALLHATEASREGIRKFDALIARHPGRSVPVIEFLTAAQLDLALARPNVVHAALLAGPASDAALSRARRFERFRTGVAGDRGNQAGTGAAHRARRLYGCV
jgi:uncharacterized protein